MSQKSIVAIQDISCYGRCSLTVALPILSACGIQTSVLPTAVLSTHTGGFKGITLRDLTSDIEPIAEHWNREGISFDAIYCGYLCSPSQIYSVMSAIDKIKNDDTILIVDPVIGDNGEAYSGFSVNYPSYMLRLCQKADIITPNITEGCMLAGIPYKKDDYDIAYIKNIVTKLYELTNAKIVLTGVSIEKRKIGAAIYDGEEFILVSSDKQSKNYHSTGDIFTSVLIGGILTGRSIKASTQIAVNFVSQCIKQTIKDKSNPRNGVNFEVQIPNLIKYFQ